MPEQSLHNRYHLMRHGESLANVADLIVSKPENGVRPIFGLSERGKEQARRSAIISGLSSRAIIYSSDFSRAHETAWIVADTLGARTPILSHTLRERDFGKWELTSTANYRHVWETDKHLATSHPVMPVRRIDGVESPAEVLARTSRLVALTEQEYRDENILFVSHGDTLQIMQTGFEEVPPHQHRSLPHMDTAEIRRIN